MVRICAALQGSCPYIGRIDNSIWCFGVMEGKEYKGLLSLSGQEAGGECEIAEYVSADEYLLDQTEHDLLFLDIELAGDGSSISGLDWRKEGIHF